MAWQLSRRNWLTLTGLGSVAGGLIGAARTSGQNVQGAHIAAAHENHAMGTVGRVPFDTFNPTGFLRTWNFSGLAAEERAKWYRETARPDGTMLREYEIYALDRQIEIA